MSLLQVENLRHSFGDKILYTDASFALHRGEHMGVVGQNGSGKSTLLKLLLGEIVADEGRILWQNGLDIGHIDQYSDIVSSQSIREYLRTAFQRLYDIEREMLALCAGLANDTNPRALEQLGRCQELLDEGDFYSVDTRIARVAAGLALDAIGMDRPLRTLSGGQRTKVILGKLLLAQPDVLLMDEPTNFLDSAHIEWLASYLATFRGSVILVSHDFDFLEKVTTCICDIEFQDIRKYHGKYSDFARQKEHRREDYLRRYAAQERTTARLSEYIEKNRARASTARMARSRQNQLDRMKKIPPPSVLAAPHIRFQSAPVPHTSVLEAHKLSIGYESPLLPAISLKLRGGEKVAISGFNGIGKTTLLRTLIGELPALDGFRSFSPLCRIGYFAQDMLWDAPEQTPLQLLDLRFPGRRQRELRSRLARCGLSAKQAMQPLSSLSGGEQNKVKLSLLTFDAYNFLILDEPTNHLDAETKESLREALREFEGNVLMVCHERAFYQDWIAHVIDIESIAGKPSPIR